MLFSASGNDQVRFNVNFHDHSLMLMRRVIGYDFADT